MSEPNIIRDLLVRIGVEADDETVVKMDTALQNVRKAMLAAAAAAAATAAAITALTVSEANSVRVIDDQAHAIGTTVEQLSALTAAFGSVGVDGKDVVDSINTINDRARDAAAGMKNMVDDFALIGLSVDELRDKDPSKVFLMFTEAVGQTEDAGDRMAAVVRLLGDDVGRRMAPHLLEGADGLRAMMEAAKEAGAVIDGQMAEASRSLTDELARTGQVTDGLRRRFALGFAPAIESLSRSFRGFIDRNRELINLKIDQTVDLLTASAKVAVPVLAALGVAMAAITGVLTYQALLPFAALITTIGAPIAAATAAIIGLTLGFNDLFVTLSGGDSALRRFLDLMLGEEGAAKAIAAVNSILSSLGKIGSEAFDKLATSLQPLTDALSKAWNILKQIGGLLAGELGKSVVRVLERTAGVLDGSQPLSPSDGGALLSSAVSFGGGGVTGALASAAVNTVSRTVNRNVGAININGAGDPALVAQEVRRVLDGEANLIAEAGGGA